MMMRSRRALLVTVLLTFSLATGSGRGQQPPGRTATGAAAEITALIAQLDPFQQRERLAAWSAAARLQKLGQPAAAALVSNLRQDSFRDNDHGNDSPIMEALAKMGESAIAEIDRALTSSVLSSTDSDDANQVTRATRVLVRIGADVAAASLVRIARTARDPGVREQALRGLAVPWRESSEPGTVPLPSSVLETCQGRQWASCPFDESPRVAAAVRPVLVDVANLLRREPDIRVRLAAAEVLARWGDGALRSTGEQELIVLAARVDAGYVRWESVKALGRLGVISGRSVVRAQATVLDPRFKRDVAQALVRLRDPAYIPVVVSLMTSGQGYPLQWSMETARLSRDVAFVPGLIDRLDDETWTGRTVTTTVDGRLSRTQLTVGSEALGALRALTFQDFGSDVARWRDWWESNRALDWRTHLIGFVAQTVPKMKTAGAGVVNEWMDSLEGAADPAVLPFVAAYLRQPGFNPFAAGPNQIVIRDEPVVITLLLALVGHGSAEARQLLYECLDATANPLSFQCAKAVASFDPSRAAEGLDKSLNGWTRPAAAELLLTLGDIRGIPALIEELERPDSLGWGASVALRYYTQEDITFDPAAPVEIRKAAASEWARWWQRAGSTFVVRKRAARIDLQCCRI